MHIIEPRHITIEKPPSHLLRYLEMTCFNHIASIGPRDSDGALLIALSKRWRPETHTFIFPWGECTITL